MLKCGDKIDNNYYKHRKKIKEAGIFYTPLNIVMEK